MLTCFITFTSYFEFKLHALLSGFFGNIGRLSSLTFPDTTTIVQASTER